MVGGGLDGAAGGGVNAVHLSVSRREDMGHGARAITQGVVQSPHGDVPRPGAIQLAQGDLSSGVGAHDASGSSEAPGFAQVGQHRLLVVAGLGSAVQLTDRDDRDFEFLGQELQRARELTDFLLAGFDFLAGGHQLHVVDDHEAQVVALLESAALRPNLGHGHIGRVVHEQRCLVQNTLAAGDLAPFRIMHLARPHVVQGHLRFGAEQPHHDLVAAHLEAEDDTGQTVLDGGRTRDVQAQCRVVGGDHGSAGQEEMRVIVDFDAPHGHRRYGTDRGHEALLCRSVGIAAPSLLVEQILAVQHEDRLVTGEGEQDGRLCLATPTRPGGDGCRDSESGQQFM